MKVLESSDSKCDNLNGLCLQEFMPIGATYNDLTQVLGQPTFKEVNDKIQYMWGIEYQDTFFSLYNTSPIVQSEKDSSDVEWHVGGTDYLKSLQLISEIYNRINQSKN